MDDEEKTPRPACYGRLETVFPMGEDGLRHTPPECLECDVKTPCLRRAVEGEQGVPVREERLARAWRAGHVGFLGRWAELKALKGRREASGRWAAFWLRLRRRLRRG